MPTLLIHEEVNKMAEVTAESEQETEVPEKVEPVESESTDEETTKPEEEQAPPGIEVTMDRKGSLPKGNRGGLNKRFNKLNARNAATAEERDAATNKLGVVEKKNEILQMQIDQMRSGEKLFKKPNPDNYEGGNYDPAFESDSAKFNIREEVAKQVQETTKGIRERQESDLAVSNLRQHQETHYKQAYELEVNDFDETEDKALEILGLEAANAIISNFNKDSHLLMYFFGKEQNKADADHFRSLWDSNKIQAVAEIGGILAELKVNPKTATPQTEPDEEIQGGSASNVESMKRKYNKLLDKKGKNPSDQTIYPEMIQLKKEAKEKGYRLE